MRKHKETEQEAIERRKQMYGCDGECVYSIYNPETKDYEEYMCGGVDSSARRSWKNRWNSTTRC